MAGSASGSPSGSSDEQGGEIVQELSELQNAVQNGFDFVSTINNSLAMANANTHTVQLIDNATSISRYLPL